jgi:hypothetical protein
LTGYCVYTYRIKYKYIKLFSRKALWKSYWILFVEC